MSQTISQMEFTVNEVNLNEVCRVCLSKTDDMIDFSTEDNLKLMLNSIGSFEIIIDVSLPHSLCTHCEDQLRNAYEFQQALRKTDEIIRECLENVEVKTETTDVKPEEEIKLETPRRLDQFSEEMVAEAIERAKLFFERDLTCIRCGFVSSHPRALAVHMMYSHRDVHSNWCHGCNKLYDNLPDHECDRNGRNVIKCEFCVKTFPFTSRGNLFEHIRMHSIDRPCKCDVCGRGYVSQRHLKVHMRTHSNERPYRCAICPKTFTQSGSLQIHVRNHARYMCTNCNSGFSKRKTLREHICVKKEEMIDGEENRMVKPINFCEACGRRVRSLEGHMAQVHGAQRNGDEDEMAKKAVLCTVCGRTFRSNFRLKVHMRTHTGETPYQCSYCDRKVTTRPQLVVHERTHTGEKPHVCRICGKGFAQSGVLNTHMRIHTGRPEVCTICSKRFCRPSELRLHMRRHTGEKPYVCAICPSAFSQQSHLNEHMKKHTDERPFHCQYCNRAFKQNSSLKAHVNIHLGTKPYKCSRCPYAARQSHSLTLHMKMHAEDRPRPDKPHICTICQRGFSTIAMLTSHIRLTHSGNVQNN